MKRSVQLAFGAILTSAASVVVLGIRNWLDRYTIDYSARPSAEVFRSVMGAAPVGIAPLRVAGRSHAFGLKHEVVMRFGYTDTALQRLLKDSEPLGGERAREQIQSYGRLGSAADRTAVGWEEVYRILEPEVHFCGVGKPNSSFVWSGVLVLDRQRRVAYVSVSGD